MNFRIPCTCGESISVGEGGAGASLTCTCGRIVAVPSLDELRKQEGLSPRRPSPKVLIKYMLADGELPTKPTCAQCDGTASETVFLTAECEITPGSGRDVAWGKMLAGYMLLGVFGAILAGTDRSHRTVDPDNLILHLPLRMCADCRRSVLGLKGGKRWLLLALLLAGFGVVSMFLWTEWGGIALGLSVIALAAAGRATQRQRSCYRQLLLHEPIYRDLLADYPDAALIFDGEEITNRGSDES